MSKQKYPKYPVIVTQIATKPMRFVIGYWDGDHYRTFECIAVDFLDAEKQVHAIMNEIAHIHQEQLEYSVCPIGVLNYHRIRYKKTKLPKSAKHAGE